MIIISGKDISKAYGTDIIFEDVCFGVEKGDRIGMVGANGTGKSTLLGIIAGDIEATSGDLYIRNDINIGYLRQQNHFGGSGTVREQAEKSLKHMFDMEKELERLQLAIADHESASFDRDLEEYTRLIEEYEKKGGYTYKSELEAMLVHMGFDEEAQNKEISKLSGGERTRLALSCLLLSKPDVLILDEPTNHLDLRMLEWLESYLDGYKGTLMVVSHDRYFLDRITNRIFDLGGGTLEAYTGNYSEFLVKREERLEAMRREYEKQQAEIARQEEMIRRFKQHGTEHLAKRAASREKRLAMLELKEKPKLRQNKMKLSFEADFKSGGEVLEAEDLSKSFGGRKLFDHVGLLLRKGERVCIIGDNGIGKTTLLKILMGLEKPDDGYLRTGYNVEFGYYDQGQLLLDENETVLGEMKNAYHLYTDTEMRSLLGRFLFTGDDVFKQVKDLSGGEKAKLSLLKLMLSGANTLVLDEPTNHLDIESKEVVEEALMEFEGTLLIVSHDRYLLNLIPDRILELTEHGLVEYKGKFDYYLEKSGRGAGREADGEAVKQKGRSEAEELELTRRLVTDSEARRKAGKQQEAEQRRRERRAEAAENRIHEIECEIADIQDEMALPENSTDIEWMRERSTRLAELEAEVTRLYDEWMELQQQ
ncbi:MAG: ABC-F family ATP-binding cassette domain-containing protein [Clostridiales bacterium]|nr:ABC-F family ATP-binding cassette domain-containing protein [Clostridiales bacterium]